MVFFRALAATAAFLAVLVALALPAAAGAATPRKVPAAMDAAARVAQRYWGATPCGGAVVLVARQTVTAAADPGTDAWVTFGSPLGANNLAAAATTYTNCTIAFGRSRWPTPASMREDWDMLCLTMVHETGHLLGRIHESTPGSVMSPLFTDLSSVPQACKSARPRARR